MQIFNDDISVTLPCQNGGSCKERDMGRPHSAMAKAFQHLGAVPSTTLDADRDHPCSACRFSAAMEALLFLTLIFFGLDH